MNIKQLNRHPEGTSYGLVRQSPSEGLIIYLNENYLNLKMQTAKGGYLYMVCSIDNKFIYTGVTSSLIIRIPQHKEGYYKNSYSIYRKTTKLVYYQFYETIDEAFEMEKYLKGKVRSFKINLIDDFNSNWEDLFIKSEELGLE